MHHCNHGPGQTDSMEEYDGVFFDDEKAMCEATKALIHGGHTKIGLLNATMDRVLARGRTEDTKGR